MGKKYLFLLGILLAGFAAAQAQVREEFLLEKNWRFSREDKPEFVNASFDDSRWQQVTVPHDWAIYGPFSPKNDVQNVAIVQDGQTEATEHAGRTGGLPFVGVGWYRTQFSVPSYEEGKHVTLLFDGAMSHARVYVNGKEAGYWPYGYNSFFFDVTDLVNGKDENTLAVRLENLPESSRWYPGAGIYRNVHVIVTEDVHVPVWGTQVTTPMVNEEYAKVNVKTSIVRPAGDPADDYRLSTLLVDGRGNTVARTETVLRACDYDVFEQELVVKEPMLWSPETPALYTAVSRLYEGETLKDEYKTRFGIRSIEVIPGKGFFLNGEKTIFRGVCLHHDLGPLGGAVNKAAIERQLRILKDMGCNAIRTSHNMPAPELVDACDEMGIMMMAESFDEWAQPKCQNGYNLLFDEWAEKDLVNLVRHYRNNPCVVMWSIGNEIPEQGVRGGNQIARFLRDICHREDPTRPVTQGMNNVEGVVSNGFASVMDIVGLNYHPGLYPKAYELLPQQLVLGAETISALSSRGIYKFPLERRVMHKYDDHQASSYGVDHVGWGCLPEDHFIQYEDYPWCMGEFVWTGFDYLGEPTPYYSDWPSHSSLFGIVDLAGIPKDLYYLYRSFWNPEEETLHILPHWNWEGREGEVTPVFVYTNYPSAELFINGKSQGKRTKDLSVKVQDSGDKDALNAFERQKRYRLMWMDTKYEPGTLKVVAYDAEGKPVAEREIHTAGKPYRIELSADRTTLKADGRDLAFITVKVVDEAGNLCPEAANLIRFKVKGAGTYRAAANGDPTCTYLFHKPEMPLFSGMLTAIVQSSEEGGKIRFEASAKGIRGAVLELDAE